MGYDVHITRAEEWFDSKEHPIPLDEWLEYVVNDPEMRHDGFAELALSESETLRLDAQGLCVWTAYSSHGENGNMAWFYWSDGQVQVKNPDDEILEKMRAIATQLAANVIGDDGEHYGRSSRSQTSIECSSSPARKRNRVRQFLRCSGISVIRAACSPRPIVVT